MKYCVICLAAGLFVLTSSWRAEATHLRAADIKVEPVCGSPRTFKITVIGYLNTLSATMFGTNSEVYFGDGSFDKIPLTFATPRPDLGANIAIAAYVTTHTYESEGAYLITYLERDRSSGVLNIDRSDDVPYVTNVTIQVTSKFACNNYPVLAVPPLDRACHKSTFYHTSGAYDIDGDSLSYELGIPLADETTQAAYTPPNNAKFYTIPARGNEEEDGPATFSIDPLTGLLSWDAPGMIGEYNIAFRIIEWRKDNVTGTYDKISTTTRDMQIIVEECANIRPELIVPADTCVVAGSLIDIMARGTDADGHDMKIEVYSEIIDLPADQNPADFSPRPAIFVPAASNPAAQLTWTTSCLHVRQQPYQVVFKITDNPVNGPRLVNFKVWHVRVIAPPPVQVQPQLDLVTRKAELSWSTYTCTNAQSIQVWRKVGSYPGAAAYCDIRSPSLWGYKLIKELPPGATAFIDDNFGRGLSVGAMYCYRIVAAYPDTRSYPSKEFCVGPIQADAPVITHVSVVETAVSGAMQVSWRSPFNISSTQFPGPYEYEVYRADDFIGETGIVRVGRVSDTTYRDIGLNTEDGVFNYRIVLYAKPSNSDRVVPIDTSATASSVRLTVKEGDHQMELSWRDSVAWSNVVDSNPWHDIYRSADNSDPAAMELIGSVDVTIDGFKYIDRGTDSPLEDDKRYSYRVLTRGTYGNPQIKILENFSQVTSSYPASDLLPCQPVVFAETLDCEEYVQSNNCDVNVFTNNIRWSLVGLSGCRKDVEYYNVYASSERGGEYGLIATGVVDTFYVDTGLSSYARCYRVSAFGEQEEEGPKSDSVCNNNCPSYMLPNVFSPNDDGYNESFHARFNQDTPSRAVVCPRFVRSVDILVLNRWGREVYRRRTEETENALDFEWDGHDNDGTEMPAGVYYYNATVRFDMLDEGDRERKIKGWVQLIR